MTLTSARFGPQTTVPIGALEARTHFQGAGWARDPNSGLESFFQMQAMPTSRGDVEDLRVHRYALVGTTLTYRDTMVGLGFGHCQTTKVRISVAGNPHLWLGLETYDRSGKTIGYLPHKVRYRPGTMRRDDDYVVPVAVGGNYAAPIDCPDWTIVLRRPSGANEVYEWYDERELAAAVPKVLAAPLHRLTVPKADDYQGSCALGTHEAPEAVLRINGAATTSPQWVTQFRDGLPTAQLDSTNIISGSGGGTVEEPEAILTVRGQVWVGKQTSPYDKTRIVGYRPIVGAE